MTLKERMPKQRYCIASFNRSSRKDALSQLSKHVLRKVDDIFQILRLYAEESHGQYPQMILHDMIQNNESLFGPEVPDINPCSSKSSQRQSSRESSSSLKEDSGSSCLKEETKEALVPENMETKTISADSQESVKLSEIAEVLISLAGNDKMDIDSATDESEVKPKKNESTTESKVDMVDLMRRDLVKINSMSIIKQDDFMGVEIDIDKVISPMKSQQDSSPTKSPSSSPLKGIKSTDSPPIGSESLSSVDYSDLNMLDFISKRLLSILACRKTCMEEIHDFYQKVERDIDNFINTTNNIDYVVRNLPMSKEPYKNDDLLELRSDLINKSAHIKEEAMSWREKDKEKAFVFENCVKDIAKFEKEHVPLLSAKGETNLDVSDLERIESGLNEICKNADSAVILEEGRRASFLKFSLDLDWLVKHFVKFLILTELLIPKD